MRWNAQGREIPEAIEPVTTKDGTRHELTITERADGDRAVRCSCGLSWSHQRGTSDADIADVFTSHCAYFNRPKTVTL